MCFQLYDIILQNNLFLFPVCRGQRPIRKWFVFGVSCSRPCLACTELQPHPTTYGWIWTSTERPAFSVVITTQNSWTKNNLINILLLLQPSPFAVSKCTTLCQKILGFPFHWISHSTLFQPHLSLSKLLTTLLPPLSTTDLFLISRSQLTHHHSDGFRASGRSSARERKIDFRSWAVEVRRYFVPVTAGCAASWSERSRTADHADWGCWIA